MNSPSSGSSTTASPSQTKHQLADESLCNVCHQRPRYLDPKTGILYEQCGKSCRDRAEAEARAAAEAARKPPTKNTETGNQATGGQTTVPTTDTAEAEAEAGAADQRDDGLCIVCRKNPRAIENGIKYATCDIACAGKLKAATGLDPDLSGLLCNVCHQRPRVFDAKKGILYPQCGNACRARAKEPSHDTPGNPGDQTTAPSDGPDYSISTLIPANEIACLMCWLAPRNIEYPGPFCSDKCAKDARVKAPLLLEAPRGHIVFADVAERLRSDWEDKEKTVVVRKVFRVVLPGVNQDKYNGIKSNATRTEQQLWFGATRTCAVGSTTKLCDAGSSESCQLCSILRQSFDAGAFSRGISLFPQSDLADIEAKKAQTSAPFKTLLFTNVATPPNVPKYGILQRPLKKPDGSDFASIETPLGIDEVIAFNGEPLLPVYLVLYESK